MYLGSQMEHNSYRRGFLRQFNTSIFQGVFTEKTEILENQACIKEEEVVICSPAISLEQIFYCFFTNLWKVHHRRSINSQK